MQQLTNGANTTVNTTHPITVAVNAPGDLSAYLLGADGKVRGDPDMVFYNQTRSGDGSVHLTSAGFTVDLSRVDMGIERIALCAAVDSGTIAQGRMLRVEGSGSFVFQEDSSAMTEAAVILGEFYRRNGAWKFRAVAQGFNGGLAPLSRHFGVDVEGESEAESMGHGADKRPEPAPQISLKKVTLGKAERVDLRKGGGAIRAKLVWAGRGDGDGDLDLYCFYVLRDGTRGKVYWKDLGRKDILPWITLSGDSQTAGEEEVILHRPDELKYVLFAAYSAVDNGIGSFESFRPKMILTDQDGSEVTVPLLNPNSMSYWVAISHLTIGRTITIEHVETYGKSGSRAPLAAERSPRLHSDGSWDISKGPIEFKRG